MVADPETYPRWNSAVRSVVPADPARARYRMVRDLPSGTAEIVLEVLEARAPAGRSGAASTTTSRR